MSLSVEVREPAEAIVVLNIPWSRAQGMLLELRQIERGIVLPPALSELRDRLGETVGRGVVPMALRMAG
jgi:hypothetical protein